MTRGPVELRLEHLEPMRRLLRVLQTASGFRLLFLQFNDAAQRDRLTRHLLETYGPSEILDLARPSPPEFIPLRAELERLARSARPVQVLGLDAWLEGQNGRALAHAFNLHREAIAERCPVPLLFWLSERAIKTFALEAPDFWAWRAAVLDFDARTEPELLLRLYLQQIIRETATLQLSGIDRKLASDEQEARLELAAVYTDLEVLGSEERKWDAARSPAEGLERLSEREPPLRSAIAFVNAHPCAVLLGDPGSGKSTFANFLALALAGELARLEQVNLSRLGADWTAGPLLPVRVLLREFASQLSANRAANAEDIWRHLARQLGGGLADFLPLLRHRFEIEGGLLLLDGLDEVPEARRSRVQIKEAVLDFRRQFPKARVLVTCRTYAYQRAEWRLPGFAEATLAPFNDEQIGGFVDRWYRQIAQVRGGRLAADTAGRAALLRQAIQRDPHLRELAQRPLLLTLMASLPAWRGGSLPEQREELYEQAVDLLLDVWERPKTVLDEQGRPIVQDASAAEWFNAPRPRLQEALEELAFKAHQGQPATNTPADIPETDFVQALVQATQGRVEFARVQDFIRDRAGLLLDRGGGIYAFPHRTFQEYMAARYLTRVGFPRKLVELLRHEVDRWREVYLLAGAKVARATPFAAWALLRETCPCVGNDASAQSLTDRDWRLALLAGQLLVETGIGQGRDLEPGERTCLEQVRAALARLAGGGHLPPVDRAAAGLALGKLGDSRPGVGIIESEPKRPDFLWCGPDPKKQNLPFPNETFQMGGDREAYGSSPEPFSCKRIKECFFISKFPITVAQYRLFVEEGYKRDEFWTQGGLAWRNGKADTNGWPQWLKDDYQKESFPILGPKNYAAEFQTPNHPQVGVSWHEAVAYCRWLNATFSLEQLGLPDKNWKIGLPTDAQWERAARHPDGRFFPWGNEDSEEELTARCNWEKTGIGHTSAVGLFPKGNAACGAADLSGNVWEWCQTKWAKLDDKRSQDAYNGDATLDDDEGDDARVLRGGSWIFVNPTYLRSANRYDRTPDFRDDYIGFRVVLVSVSAR